MIRELSSLSAPVGSLWVGLSALLLAGCYASHTAPTMVDEAGVDAVDGGAVDGGALLDAGQAADSDSPRTPRVTAINAGENNTCAIRDGQVYCWGYGLGGVPGAGSEEENVLSAKRVELAGSFVGVDVGSRFACAWRADGAAVCWGGFVTALLEDGSVDFETRLPFTVPLAVVRDVSVDGNHACAVTDDGTACWGFASAGGLLDGVDGPSFNASPRSVGAEGRVYVSNGRTCVLDSSSLRCAGELFGGERSTDLSPTGFGSDLIDASFGNYHACAVVRDGGLRCAGWNANGQVEGSRGEHPEPVDVRVADMPVVDVAVGAEHTCALVDDGTVWCWGGNARGQAGGSPRDRALLAPNRLELRDVRALTAGSNHTCAIRGDGSAWCWGYAEYGQLGDGRERPTGSADNFVPTPVSVRFE